MVQYNMTLLQNATRVSDLFVYANTMSTNIFGDLVLLAVFFIMLLALKRFDFWKALLSSCFGAFIIGLFMMTAGLIHFEFLLIFAVLGAVSALVIFTVKNN